MCPPVVAAVGAAFTAIGVGVQVAGEISRSNAEEAAARNNRKMAEITARDIEIQGRLEAGQLTTETTRLIAAQRSMAATNNLDASTGTAAQLAAETRLLSEVDKKIIRSNTARRAWAVRQRGAYFQGQGLAAARSSRLSAAGTALGGAGRLSRDVVGIMEQI